MSKLCASTANVDELRSTAKIFSSNKPFSQDHWTPLWTNEYRIIGDILIYSIYAIHIEKHRTKGREKTAAEAVAAKATELDEINIDIECFFENSEMRGAIIK